MVYSLDLNLKHSNNTDRDTFLGSLPSSDDSRVVTRLHQTPVSSRQEDGTYIIQGAIKYKNLSDLSNIRANLKSLNGTWSRCGVGSYIKGHQCYHDESPPSPCVGGDIFEDII